MLKEILLVDDSKAMNNLNERLLKEMGIAENIISALNGEQALDYINSKKEDGNYPKPDVIFLDINMPVMDGYQFLGKYIKLERPIEKEPIIVMLTTSKSEIDEEIAAQFSIIKGYLFKPLTKEKINEILDQYILV